MILVTDGYGITYEIVIRSMSFDLTANKSALVLSGNRMPVAMVVFDCP